MYQLLWLANDGLYLFFDAPKLMRDPYLQKPLKNPKFQQPSPVRGKVRTFFLVVETWLDLLNYNKVEVPIR